MNTLTTNTQTLAAINQTAVDIVETLEQLGFTSDAPVPNLTEKVSEILTKNLLGNTTYNESELSRFVGGVD